MTLDLSGPRAGAIPPPACLILHSHPAKTGRTALSIELTRFAQPWPCVRAKIEMETIPALRLCTTVRVYLSRSPCGHKTLFTLFNNRGPKGRTRSRHCASKP